MGETNLCDWFGCGRKASLRIRFMVKNETWAHYCEEHGEMAYFFLKIGRHKPSTHEEVQRYWRAVL